MSESCRENVPLRWLIDHRDQRLSPARLDRLESHLNTGCPACEARRNELGSTLDLLAAGPLGAPPAALLKRAGRLLGRHRRREAIDRVRQAVTRLLFDEWLEPAPALRSVPGLARRLLFAIGEGELFVTVTKGERTWSLEGEVMVPVEEVVLLREGSERRRVRVDGEGRFSADGLTRGAWTIAGVVEQRPFETPPFVL